MTVRGSDMAVGHLYAYPADACHGIAAVRIVERHGSDGLQGWVGDYKRRGASEWTTEPAWRIVFWDGCGYTFAERVE